MNQNIETSFLHEVVEYFVVTVNEFGSHFAKFIHKYQNLDLCTPVGPTPCTSPCDSWSLGSFILAPVLRVYGVGEMSLLLSVSEYFRVGCRNLVSQSPWPAFESFEILRTVGHLPL